ncbi:MAG TPA: STAS domain-containing protein [Pyrinomonadaceae bacterium]
MRRKNSMVNLYINERRAGDVTILDLKGRVRIGGGTVALHSAIKCLVSEGKLKILLNLAEVTHIDSSGLGEIIASSVTLNRNGGDIKLIRLTESLRDLMVITKLLTVFEVYEDEQEALPKFASGPSLMPLMVAGKIA